MRLDLPRFETKDELFKHLKDNQEDFIYQAKQTVKQADGIVTNNCVLKKPTSTSKSSDQEEGNPTELKVKAIINTTNILDSHSDVHIKGLWNKSLKENRLIKHVQEHKLAFDKIIADKEDLQASVKTYKWKDLGFDAEGETQALVFDSLVKESRNKYMFEQYKEGHVDNHSVGMKYVNLHLCINSEEKYYKEEKENWDKYISEVINVKEAENQGYFWAVTAAKIVEGSAVPLGSNTVTPTQSVEPVKTIQQTEEPNAAALARLKAYKNIFIKSKK